MFVVGLTCWLVVTSFKFGKFSLTLCIAIGRRPPGINKSRTTHCAEIKPATLNCQPIRQHPSLSLYHTRTHIRFLECLFLSPNFNHNHWPQNKTKTICFHFNWGTQHFFTAGQAIPIWLFFTLRCVAGSRRSDRSTACPLSFEQRKSKGYKSRPLWCPCHTLFTLLLPHILLVLYCPSSFSFHFCFSHPWILK